MDNPGLAVHKRCLPVVGAGRIFPHSALSELCSCKSSVSAENNANRQDALFCLFLTVLEPAGILVMNGDGVSRTSEVGEGC